MRRFLRATRRAIEWTNANTEQAAEVLKRRFPDQNAERAAWIWRRESELQGDGSNDFDKWQALGDFLDERGTVEQAVGVATS